MKRYRLTILAAILVILTVGFALAQVGGPVADYIYRLRVGAGGINTDGSVTAGSPITAIATEKNTVSMIVGGQVVGKLAMECSNITADAQVCTWHLYAKADTPGTLTEVAQFGEILP